MYRWKLISLAATAIIVITIPLSVVKFGHRQSGLEKWAADVTAEFVGSEKCKSCHQPEYNLWKGSHHDHAMGDATEKNVLGDFNDAVFEHRGKSSKFYRKEGKFFVHTQGPEGKMGDFEITHTFGWFPLQQYLVPFSGGRLQCLPIAWDVKAKRWYHLYPNQAIDPKDWLYWTNAAQNWNGMCAECHSTNLKKNYDLRTDSYKTTWTDINVGCEACHGPGSRHVKWAELPDMARPPVQNFELPVRTSKLRSREAVELCAPCHSRRAILGDYTHIEPDLLDTMLPSLLTRDLYFPDGQILEEVYAYASFTQSKMYARDVRHVPFHQPQEELQRPDRNLPDHLVGHQRRLRSLPRPRGQARSEAIEKSTFEAAYVPAEVIKNCREVITLLEPVSKKGNQNSLSDTGVAIAVIAAASEGAFLNVLINYSSLNEKQKAAELLMNAENLNNEVKEEAQYLLAEISGKIRGN